jgi:hypothetical protein
LPLIPLGEVVLPSFIERIGFCLDLNVPFVFDGTGYSNEPLSRGFILKYPLLAFGVDKVAAGNPLTGFVGMPSPAPAEDTIPNVTIQLGKALGTDTVAMLID